MKTSFNNYWRAITRFSYFFIIEGFPKVRDIVENIYLSFLFISLRLGALNSLFNVFKVIELLFLISLDKTFVCFCSSLNHNIMSLTVLGHRAVWGSKIFLRQERGKKDAKKRMKNIVPSSSEDFFWKFWFACYYTNKISLSLSPSPISRISLPPSPCIPSYLPLISPLSLLPFLGPYLLLFFIRSPYLSTSLLSFRPSPPPSLKPIKQVQMTITTSIYLPPSPTTLFLRSFIPSLLPLYFSLPSSTPFKLLKQFMEKVSPIIFLPPPPSSPPSHKMPRVRGARGHSRTKSDTTFLRGIITPVGGFHGDGSMLVSSAGASIHWEGSHSAEDVMEPVCEVRECVCVFVCVCVCVCLWVVNC